MNGRSGLILVLALLGFARPQEERYYSTYLQVGAGYSATCSLTFETSAGRQQLSSGTFPIGQTRTLIAPEEAVNIEYSCRAILGQTIFTHRFPQQNGNHCFQVWGTTLNTRFVQELCGDDGVDCFDRGVRYGGGFVAVTSTFSEFHCQIECELHEECAFFNFYEGQCVMVTTKEPISDSPGALAGPKNCPGTPMATQVPTPPPTSAPTEVPGAPTEVPLTDAPTSPGGFCDNLNDRDIIMSDPSGWDNQMTDCATRCFGAGACVAECMEDATGVTTGCAGCFGDTSQCTTDNCFFPCLLNPNSAGCRDCSRQHCRAPLIECTGLEDDEIPFQSYAVSAAQYFNDEDYLNFVKPKS